jgi:hypothetical protein
MTGSLFFWTVFLQFLSNLPNSITHKTITIALTPEVGCNKTAMGLPVTFAVFLIAKWVKHGVSEEYLRYLCYPFGNKA